MRADTPEDRRRAGACSAQIGGFGDYFARLPDMLLAEWDGEIIGGTSVHVENCFLTESFPGVNTFGPLGVLETYRDRGVACACVRTRSIFSRRAVVHPFSSATHGSRTGTAARREAPQRLLDGRKSALSAHTTHKKTALRGLSHAER